MVCGRGAVWPPLVTAAGQRWPPRARACNLNHTARRNLPLARAQFGVEASGLHNLTLSDVGKAWQSSSISFHNA